MLTFNVLVHPVSITRRVTVLEDLLNVIRFSYRGFDYYRFLLRTQDMDVILIPVTKTCSFYNSSSWNSSLHPSTRVEILSPVCRLIVTLEPHWYIWETQSQDSKYYSPLISFSLRHSSPRSRMTYLLSLLLFASSCVEKIYPSITNLGWLPKVPRVRLQV